MAVAAQTAPLHARRSLPLLLPTALALSPPRWQAAAAGRGPHLLPVADSSPLEQGQPW